MAANFLKYVLYQKYLIIQAETFYIVYFFGSKVGFLLANTDMTAKKPLWIASDGPLPSHHLGMRSQVQDFALPNSVLWQPGRKIGVFSIAAFFQASWDVSPITHWLACVPERQELPWIKGWTGDVEKHLCLSPECYRTMFCEAKLGIDDAIFLLRVLFVAWAVPGHSFSSHASVLFYCMWVQDVWGAGFIILEIHLHCPLLCWDRSLPGSSFLGLQANTQPTAGEARGSLPN